MRMTNQEKRIQDLWKHLDSIHHNVKMAKKELLDFVEEKTIKERKSQKKDAPKEAKSEQSLQGEETDV